MRHRLPRRARLACAATKAGAFGTLAVLALGGPGAALGVHADPTLDADRQAATMPTAVERQMTRHQCSTTGFEDQQPLSALVRSARGTLRFVDFETGWQVYTRHGAASLVAVCLGEPPVRVSPVSR